MICRGIQISKKKYSFGLLNIEIVFSGMKGPVRDVLEKSGIMNNIGYTTVL